MEQSNDGGASAILQAMARGEADRPPAALPAAGPANGAGRRTARKATPADLLIRQLLLQRLARRNPRARRLLLML
ncbi:hypothetical protein SAMN06265365_101231 [Tistlia consotensis]|uniref:Uncharacterized protein n=1 Tax=Tistlia consotensis USBA 355 TaxID=560819 RepID=A0A1Y6BA38_9PROT|nr:hypothetical protein [Tistlia consotensis]SME89627.1 hypothetical protein SAMN05428998_101229 [Tistlia consotensis USBA 355]SNR26120.1 hypothetical protein SAMN06265365_101231 [Tistlia consotensis]